jgi:transcriptional regulator with XRE-family HTH domain
MKPARQMEILRAFGAQLREMRKSRKLPQKQLAWKAELEMSQISRIERGIINAGVKQVFKIAEALEVHPKKLFDFEMPENVWLLFHLKLCQLQHKIRHHLFS